jgi:hypothetical protein
MESLENRTLLSAVPAAGQELSNFLCQQGVEACVAGSMAVPGVRDAAGTLGDVQKCTDRAMTDRLKFHDTLAGQGDGVVTYAIVDDEGGDPGEEPWGWEGGYIDHVGGGGEGGGGGSGDNWDDPDDDPFPPADPDDDPLPPDDDDDPFPPADLDDDLFAPEDDGNFFPPEDPEDPVQPGYTMIDVAPPLFFAAGDGGSITPLERDTLNGILWIDGYRYQVNDDGSQTCIDPIHGPRPMDEWSGSDWSCAFDAWSANGSRPLGSDDAPNVYEPGCSTLPSGNILCVAPVFLTGQYGDDTSSGDDSGDHNAQPGRNGDGDKGNNDGAEPTEARPEPKGLGGPVGPSAGMIISDDGSYAGCVDAAFAAYPPRVRVDLPMPL